MATMTITRAEQDGQHIALRGEVDEGAAGIVTYDARVVINELRPLPQAERMAMMKAALKAEYDVTKERNVVNAQLANLIGAEFTV